LAPRAYWKGFLKLSLVSCPISLFPATSAREKISFHQLNKETGNRVRYRKVDEQTGDEVDFTLNLPASGNVPPTFATNLTFADSRDNADAAHGTITSSCSGDRSYTIPSTTGATAAVALAAFVNSACTYTLNVGGRTQALGQSSTNNVTLHRLDVDAVTVTREDGSTYTVNGTYTLNFGGVQVAGPYNTGTGVDVLAGTYQFTLSYTDFDGPQTQTQSLTF